MVRHAWSSNCAEIDGVEITQLLDAVCRKKGTRLSPLLRSPIKPAESQVKPESISKSKQHPCARVNDLGTNSVTRNHRNSVFTHRSHARYYELWISFASSLRAALSIKSTTKLMAGFISRTRM